MILATACLVGFTLVQAQDRVVDSLELRLKQVKDTTRFRVYAELFEATNRSNYEKALGYARQAYNLAESLGDSVKIVEGGRMMAYSLDDLGRYAEVVKTLNHVIGIANRNQTKYPRLKSRLKSLYNNVAIAYMHRGNYDSSLYFHFKSLEIREQENDKRGIGTAKNNIGLVYFKLRNHTKALEYYEQALLIKREINDNNNLDKVLINIGLCFNELNKPKEAIRSCTDALNLCGNNCSDASIKEATHSLGIANLNLGNVEVARNHFARSLEISKRYGDMRFQIENLLGLAISYRMQSDYETATRYLNEANVLAEDFGNAELRINVYKESFITYNMIADLAQTSAFQRKYIQLKDSIYSADLLRNLATIQTNYEQRENLKTIRLINENIRLKDEQIKRQRIQYVFIVLVTVLIASLAGVLVWANRRQQRQNRALSEAKKTIEKQNTELTRANEELDRRVREKTIDLIDANMQLVDVNEELDNYIYRTAHDLRGPLVTLKGVCNVAFLDVKDPLAIEYLKRLDVTADKLNTILTRLLMVSQINHSTIRTEKISFEKVVNNVLTKFNELPLRFKIEFKIEEGTDLESDEAFVTMILENLVANAIKFFNTSERIQPYVKVVVAPYDQDHVMISVEDNGIGIRLEDRERVFHLFVRASERSETGGIGLYLTKLSAHKLGGEVFLMETSERGTKFLVLLPKDIEPILLKRTDEERDRILVKEERLKSAKATGGTDALERYYSSKHRRK
ncbi:MAG: tetratricopeptide repeat-containing sensor histidine kinase [Cytophagales bacterium]|nr:tetratricopeptide repeat-containing sensor histidine kinase [Cytophagales bacterium]